jgi:hypothetical protein
MKAIAQNEIIQLKNKTDRFYSFAEKVDSDKLLYEITYNLADENKIVFAELIGEGTSKLTRINFNTNKGIKTGEFNTSKPFANIYFKVDKIRFYTDCDIEFKLSVYES